MSTLNPMRLEPEQYARNAMSWFEFVTGCEQLCARLFKPIVVVDPKRLCKVCLRRKLLHNFSGRLLTCRNCLAKAKVQHVRGSSKGVSNGHMSDRHERSGCKSPVRVLLALSVPPKSADGGQQSGKPTTNTL